MADNLFNAVYNPDVLSCLANLSNDEVFTPPDVVNKMLDMLPQELFQNPDTTFLDPACKTGVFLREIAKRLITGLEAQMPELQERIDHIFHKQLYAIAITELTSLLSRRGVYCSKYPQSEFSITQFDDAEGNIRYRRVQHKWKDGKCVCCGASKSDYERGVEQEAYAYEWIHTVKPEELFHMRFDVIISNPPYQLGSNDNRSTSRDKPIYNLFVNEAKKLKPRYMVMIIPSRWMASGLGLTEFRQEMLSDKHIRSLTDYPVAGNVFSGVEIKGGVCYFLWDRDNTGHCMVTSIRDNEVVGPVTRELGEYDVFVRDSRAISILHKVLSHNEESIISALSVDKEFGWTSNFEGFHTDKHENDVAIYYNRKGKRLCGWINRDEINKSIHLVDKWKVMVPKAGSDGGQKIPDIVLGSSFIAPSPSACTQTYLFFYTDSESSAKSIQKYVSTKFFRFLVSLRKITQDATRSTYTWVPMQNWDTIWTDELLNEKYGLLNEEISFIDYMIRPMDLSGGDMDAD